MKVSAIIPCYNAQSTILRAVKSVLNQTYTVDQIIVIDDGSKDNSLTVIKEFIKNYTHIDIISRPNKGVCYSRNEGIENAKGNYILMLDADDYFEPSFVEKALKVFQESTKHAAVMCGFRRIVNGRYSKAYFFKEIDLKHCLYNNGMMACVLFKKNALENVGMYDENLKYAHEDWDLNIRLLKAGYTFGILNEPLFNYTQNEHSRSSLSVEKDIQMRSIIYKKYVEDFQQNGLYLFQSFSKELIQLRKRNKRIIESRSYIFSEKLVTMYVKIRRIIGSD